MEVREPGLFVKFCTKYLILSPYMAILSIEHRLGKIKKGLVRMKKKLLERILSVIGFIVGSILICWIGFSAVSNFRPKLPVAQASAVEVTTTETVSEPAKGSAQPEQQPVAKPETTETTTTTTVTPYTVSNKLYQRPDGKYVYEIQDGDTLTLISNEVKVGVDELANLNEIRDMNEISAGAVLVLP